MLSRVFTVLAALFLVMAVAVVALAPAGMTLSRGMAMVNDRADGWLRSHSPDLLRQWVEVPLLSRPLWLLPAALGFICAGAAVSCSLGTTSPSRRRS